MTVQDGYAFPPFGLAGSTGPTTQPGLLIPLSIGGAPGTPASLENQILILEKLNLALNNLASVNSHTTAAVNGAVTAINAHTDGSVTAINAHTDTVQTAILAAIPSAASIRDAVLDSMRSGHVTTGTIGEGIAIATGLLQGNFYMDNVDNSNVNGQTAARLRVFHTGTATAAATPGGSGEGEFATFQVTTAYAGPNKILQHRVVQQP